LTTGGVSTSGVITAGLSVRVAMLSVCLGAEIPKEARLIQQERAYTAPIWDNPPEGQPRNR